MANSRRLYEQHWTQQRRIEDKRKVPLKRGHYHALPHSKSATPIADPGDRGS